ncbi:hypothetical protein [Flavobacterium sp. FlaQc-28]|uniref:hypothetical protein n=1 Tax=Flavobacterium sp. FlaQc-28 TaxID=3374178 RepID=UPI0037571468
MKYIKYIGILLLLLIVIKCFNSPDIPVNPTERKSYQQTNTNSDVDQWYLGGNLHKKDISDWKNATDANKLATCGDFIARVKKDLTLTELKDKASELKDCIDEATKGTNISDQNKVNEIGALCLVTIGY